MTRTLGRGRATRRRTMLGGLGLAAVMMLTGCLGGQPADGEDIEGGGVGTADAPVQIRMLANDAFAEQWQDKLVPEFNKVYPHIEVTIDAIPYEEMLAKSLLELTAAEPTYDIIIADDPWTPQLAETGGLLDLKNDAAQWTDADYDWDDFYAAPLASSEWDGVQYGVPLRSNLLLMFYNRSLYQQAGLEAPTPELTWEQYLQEAPKLVQDTDGDGEVDSWAVGLTWVRGVLSPPVWQAKLNADGGALFDENMEPAFNTPDGVAALQTQVDLLEYAPPGALTFNYTEPLDAFRQGKIATIFTWGSAFRSAAVDPEVTTLTPDQVGIQTMPVGSVRAGTHRGIWSGSVVKRSAHPEAAWALLQWMSSKEGERWSSNTLGVFPARRSTLSSTPEEEWLVPVFEALVNGFEVAAEGEMYRPRTPESNAIQEILADQTAAAVHGDASAEEALQQAEDEIRELLK